MTKGGKRASVSVDTGPMTDDAGNCSGLVALVADISHPRSIPCAIFESSEEAIVGKALDGMIMSWNRGAERVFGYGAAEVIGRPISILVPVDRIDGVAEIIDQIERGQHVQRFEATLMHKNGTKIDVSVSLTPIKDAVGQVVGAAMIAHDVSKRKQAELFREEYLSLIAHDLRSPLTVMMGTADLLSRKLSKPALTDERRMAQQIVESGRRMEAMIRDLVSSARLEAGEMKMLQEPTDILRLIDDLRKRVGSDEENVRVRVEGLERVPPVLADREQLERAIVNLVSNALKYSSPGSPVVVDVGLGDAEAIISVTDQGVGMSADDIPKLFERFYRAKTGRKSVGLGLGLYITRLVVQAHGGRIWVESREGEGSTFRFTVPLA